MSTAANLKICTLKGSFCPEVLDEKIQKIYDTEKWSKEKLILEKYAFLCDAIDLKQWKVLLNCRENLWQVSWMKFIL